MGPPLRGGGWEVVEALGKWFGSICLWLDLLLCPGSHDCPPGKRPPEMCSCMNSGHCGRMLIAQTAPNWGQPKCPPAVKLGGSSYSGNLREEEEQSSAAHSNLDGKARRERTQAVGRHFYDARVGQGW